MKRSILAALIVMVFSTVMDLHGQMLTVTLNVTSRPNPYVSEWASRRETAILTVTNPTGSPVDVKITAKILSGTTLHAETKFNELPVVTIPARSTQTFYGEEVAPFSAMKFYGGVETKTLRTGQIPAGNYTFCIQLRDPVTTEPRSPEVCRPFTIVSYQGPALLQPADKSTIRSGDRPTFRWTSVTPNPPSPVTYRFVLFEVLQGQAPMQAFRGNQPIIDRPVLAATQLLWLPELPLPESGKTYIWSVQALDQAGNPIGDREGFADPFVVTVGQPISQGRGVGVVRDGDGGLGRGVVAGGDEGSGKGRVSVDQEGSGRGRRAGDNGGGDAERRVGGETNPGGVILTEGLGNAKVAANGPPISVDTTLQGLNNPQPPVNNCNSIPAGGVPSCNTISTQTYGDSDSVTIAGFTMKFVGAPTGGNAALAGSGRIWVNWMRTNVAVAFTGLSINSLNQVCSGTIRAKVDSTPDTYPQQWAINIGGSFNWTKSQVKKLNKWMHANTPGKVKKLTDSLDLNQMLAEQTAPAVEVPLGFNNLEGVTIAITEMKFEPTGAHLNCVAAFPVVFDHNDTLGFKGANFPFTLNAPSVNSGMLALLADETFSGNINNTQTYDVVFKAQHGNAPGTFVSWDCKGFRELNVDMDIVFPRQWLVPIPDNGTDRVKATVLTNIVKWSDWLLQASLPKCAVTNTNGLELEVLAMAYDHSDTRNVTGMTFPASYTGDQSVAFNGFYLKAAKVVLPETMRTFSDPAQRVKIIATDIIINKLGITGDITAQNVINFPNGNISGLGASIDTVKISLKNSSLLSAYMRGKIVLPLSEVTNANTLTYKGLFNAGSGVQFTLQPDNPVEAKLFSGAKLTLAPTSVMTIILKANNSSFDLALNGKFSWDNVKIGKIKVSMKDVEFQNMKLGYQGGGLSFSPGTWSLASPPKWIANFPVSLDKIAFATKPSQPGEVLRGGLGFDVILNLSENTVSGRTSMEVVGAVEKSPGGKFVPKWVGISVSEIELHANLAAVKIDGKINIYNEDPMYGDGFAGTIKAVFNSLQTQIDASARFGATEYQSPGNPYRYWGVDARIILPKPGVVFLPGVAIYGFGGGAWKRMNVTNLPKPNLTAVAGATSQSGQNSSGATFTPDPNIALGFKVLAVVGTTPDPKSFNADATLQGQFSNGGGLTQISFGLDFWGAAALLERNKAPFWGTALISYSPPTKIFDLNATANFTYPADGSVVKTAPAGISMKLNINGGTGLWYFKLGEPTNLNTVTVFNAFSVQEYLMFGNNIQPPNGFLPSTVAGLNAAGVSVGYQNQGISAQASLGQGFAAGLTVHGSTGDKYVDLAYRTKLKYAASGGFEINMSMLRYPPSVICDGTPLGMNGWYVQGGVAAWFSGYAGVQITASPKPDCDCCPKVWKDCCNPFKCCAIYCGAHYFNIIDIRIGARLNGGFPRPTWLDGEASSHYSVLGGTFSGDFTAHLKLGNQCNIGQPEPTPGVVAEDAVATIASQGALIHAINPSNGSSGFSPDNSIGVALGYKPDDAFEVQERQADGSSKKRTFQARYTVKLDSLGPVTNPAVPVEANNPNYNAKGANQGGGGNAPKGGKNVGNFKGVDVNLQVPPGPPTVYVLTRSAGANLMGEYTYRVNRGIVAKIGQKVKNLDDLTRFKFTIIGELWEKQGAVWVKATKKNGQPFTQTMTSTFSTGVAPPYVPLQAQPFNPPANPNN